MTTRSLEELQAHRPMWMPRWMYTIPDAWGAFTDQRHLSVEEFRDGDDFVVRAELPDIDPDRDVEITVDHDVLTIRGERRVHRDEADKDGFRSEFEYGAFVRRVALPGGATEDAVKASYDDGVLEVRVTLSDTPEEHHTRIPVERR